MSALIPQELGPLLRWIVVFGLLTARYLLFAGGFFLVFYVIKRKDWFYMKIQQKFPDNKRILHEIKYSFLTFAVFGLVVVLINYLRTHGWVQNYGDWNSRPLWYYIFTSVFIIFFHDAYFYWMHRLMHHPKIYKYVHRVHHISTDPTPWAAFSFHPIEAVLEIGFVPILLLSLPIHFSSFLILSIWMIVFNVIGHLGYEIMPSWFVHNNFFKWSNTPTNHNMHHRYVNCNYGLYFNIWDRLMGTNHPKYEELFDEVTGRREKVHQEEEAAQQQERLLEDGAHSTLN